jgi:hypothetical protein
MPARPVIRSPILIVEQSGFRQSPNLHCPDRHRIGRKQLIAGCKAVGLRFVLALTAGLVPVCAIAAERPVFHDNPPDPLALYGGDIEFDVLRKGTKVGFHRVRFERDEEELVVSSIFQLEVNVLFFTAFRYLYESEGRWRHGQLLSLNATVSDNGKASFIEAAREGARMTIRTGDTDFATDSTLFPTNHWNAAVLPQSRVLNTLTGRINDVSIEPQGRETVRTERGEVLATRYAYSGELEAEVWYDDAGRWVKLRFRGRDGSTVEYVCRRCQGHVGAQASNG